MSEMGKSKPSKLPQHRFVCAKGLLGILSSQVIAGMQVKSHEKHAP